MDLGRSLFCGNMMRALLSFYFILGLSGAFCANFCELAEVDFPAITLLLFTRVAMTVSADSK